MTEAALIKHVPVLLNEVVDLLNVKEGGIYVDATCGGGGHSFGIIGRGGRVLGIDRDPTAFERVRGRRRESRRLKVVVGNFRDLDKIAETAGLGKLDGVVFDLGLSAFQLEGSGRGFSFRRDEPLDMRTDRHLTVTAREVVNRFSKPQLYGIFTKFGEERLSARLVDALEARRRVREVATTGDLFQVIKELVRSEKDSNSVAARVFQALRIFVNDEIDNLKVALPQAFERLKAHGRLAVISYHSLEDREVKRFFGRQLSLGRAVLVSRRPVRPKRVEVQANPSSRSAKLRVVEKIYD